MAKPDPTRDSTGAAAGSSLPRYESPVLGGDTLYLTREEIALMTVIVSMMPADDFNTPAAKALVYKCQANTVASGRSSRKTSFQYISVLNKESRF